jgi:hypothetical protein
VTIPTQGYVCGACGTWVPLTMGHSCPAIHRNQSQKPGRPEVPYEWYHQEGQKVMLLGEKLRQHVARIAELERVLRELLEWYDPECSDPHCQKHGGWVRARQVLSGDAQ